MTAKLPNEVAVKVVSELWQHFIVDGVAPVSLRDFDKRIDNLRASMTMEFRSALSDIHLFDNNGTATSTEEHRPEWCSWSWDDGKVCHAVPKSWEFSTRANVKAIWNLWFFGDKDTKIRPYRLLSKQHDVRPAHRMRHSRVSIVMEYMERLAKEANMLPPGVTRVSALQIPTADKVFEFVLSTMLLKLYTSKPKRAEELSCGTLYNRLCQHRRTQQGT